MIGYDLAMSYIAERREEEKERRRSEIIAAALALYAEQGWDSLTMDHVARKARLSRALLYVYFRDKDDLLFAISSLGLEELRRRFEAAAAAHQPGIDKVTAIGRAYVAFQHDLPHLYDSCARYHAHSAGDQPAVEPNECACIASGDAVLGVILAALRTGIADGSIRADIGPPEVVAITLWSFTHGLIQIMTNKGPELAMHGIGVDALAEQSFAMLRYMLGGPPRS